MIPKQKGAHFLDPTVSQVYHNFKVFKNDIIYYSGVK